MSSNKSLKNLLLASLFLIALGGWLLHFRIHPPLAHAYNLIPFLVGLVSLLVVPLLFSFKRTITYAYLYNGFTAILGTIVMTHFSIVHFKGPVTLPGILFGTLLADIAILWGKFFIGKAIFDLELFQSEQGAVPLSRYFRYLSPGWWLVHLVGWAVVYALGVWLWP